MRDTAAWRHHMPSDRGRDGQHMAKKPKKKADEEAAAPAEGPAEAKPAGSKKKLIIIAAAALLVLGGGGGGGYFWWSKKNAAEMAAAEGGQAAPVAPKKTAFLDMKEMMVNLAGQNLQGVERPRYLKMKISLELSDPKLVNEVTPLLPRIEDTFQVFTRELRASDLEGSSGVYRLKEELLRRVNIAIYPSKVEAVLFKEILIQ
jgi:flagellar FliL protein